MKPEDRLIDTVMHLDPMSELPRTGWLLRGVRPCESIADHSFGVALVAMLLTDALREEGVSLDGELVLRMALLHDAPEARTGDVPMPAKSAEAAAALDELEARIVGELLPAALAESWRVAEAGQILEARVVKASDKLHMMIKALVYEGQKRGRLDEFWQNPKNFRDMDLPLASRVFDRICERAGRARPR
ncbi:MAG: HD family hydrolase [Myxococcales bacterium]|nr:HD family hydrolase [Myxococcales bacterium]